MIDIITDFTKHRQEKYDVAVDFTDALDSGDGVSSVSSITITRFNQHTDLSSEFGSPAGSVNGDSVEMTLSQASTGEQDSRIYQMAVEVDTSNGDTLVAKNDEGNLPTLKVTEAADTNAP